MSDMGHFETLSQAAERLESAQSIDPLAKGRRGSLAELRILGFVLDCPEDMRTIGVAIDGSMTERIPLRNPLRPRDGKVYINRVTTPDGARHTEVDFSEHDGGVYRIDPNTGKTTVSLDGKEKRVGPVRQYRFANRLARLALDY